jgi:hypothetical protein
MTAGAPPQCGIMALVAPGLSRAALEAKHRTALVAAQRRLAQAEKQHLDTGTRAGEYLAVAKIALEQLNSGTQPDPAESLVRALYNRATADLAAELPTLIRQQQNSTTLSLKDPQSGQINRLQLELGSRGAYSPTYFQQILVADGVDKRGMRDKAIRDGLGGTVVGVHAFDKLSIEAPHNSIIGDRGRGDTPKSSDGVVPSWSSHLDTAQSERIVPTDHGAMNHPKAVEEVRRILLQQLRGDNSQRTTRTSWQNRTRLQAFSPQVGFAATNP